MAKKIVAEFGEKTLEIIAKSPNELLKVPGIGKKTAEKISTSYLEQSELTEIMVWLENHGISNTYAGKIFAKYGSFAIDIMEKDIYRLFQDIEGIGFLTADKLAFNLGIQRDDKRRIISGIDYALMQLCNNGHCCIPEMALVDKTAKILQVNNQIIFTILKERIDNGSLNTEVVGGETLIYPPYLYYAEKKLLRVYFNYNKQLSLYQKIIFLYLSKYGKKTIKSNLHKNKKKPSKLVFITEF